MSLEDKVNDLNKDEMKLIEKVKKKGLTVKEFDYYLTQIDKSKIEPRNYTIGKTNVKFGVISDTHIGSKYYDSNLMTFAAKQFSKEKVDFVIHTGDIIEGMYPSRGGQLYELSEIGIDAQIEKAVKELKKIEQPIYFITGNHDYTSKRLAGMVVGTRIEDKVPNSKFLGEDYGRITLKNDVTIDLVHPGDGSSYAISYKSQKRIDSLEGGEKPNLMFIGHYHKAEYIFYRNIHAFQSATLESQTPFMKSKGLAANKGFYIINLKTKKGQVDRITPTFYPAYN